MRCRRTSFVQRQDFRGSRHTGHRRSAQDYKQYLKVFNAQQLEVDPKLVGLPGSPTIVYKVERIPKAKASRKAEIVDGTSRGQVAKVASKMYEVLEGMVIR